MSLSKRCFPEAHPAKDIYSGNCCCNLIKGIEKIVVYKKLVALFTSNPRKMESSLKVLMPGLVWQERKQKVEIRFHQGMGIYCLVTKMM